MALRALIETLDDVPEDIRGEYKEQKQGDKTVFVLDVEGVDMHPSVINLKTAHERQKQTNKTLTTDLAALRGRVEGLPDDFNADEYERMKALAEGKEGPKPEEQIARVRDQLERKHATEIQKKDDQIAKLSGTINRVTVEEGLSKALDAAGIDPKHKNKLVPYLKSIGKIDLEEDEGNYTAIAQTDMGPVPLARFVSEWAVSDDGKDYVAPAKGGDAPGNHRLRNGESNPFGKQAWNKTEQGKMVRIDRKKAENFAQAAGFKNLDVAVAARQPVAA
jgi:hypothetical protein